MNIVMSLGFGPGQKRSFREISGIVLMREPPRTCPACKKRFPVEYRFCPFDGTPLPTKTTLWELARARLMKAKPPGKKWSELTAADRKAMVKAAAIRGLERRDLEALLGEIWREKRVEEAELPSDDPAERWKKLAAAKYKNIRRIDLRDAEGFLSCPQVDVYADADRKTVDGQMNHDEWVVILETRGAMTRVKRRKDKKVGFFNDTATTEIYTPEDIRPKKPELPKEPKARRWALRKHLFDVDEGVKARAEGLLQKFKKNFGDPEVERKCLEAFQALGEKAFPAGCNFMTGLNHMTEEGSQLGSQLFNTMVMMAREHWEYENEYNYGMFESAVEKWNAIVEMKEVWLKHGKK
jgi:hypothetical protein